MQEENVELDLDPSENVSNNPVPDDPVIDPSANEHVVDTELEATAAAEAVNRDDDFDFSLPSKAKKQRKKAKKAPEIPEDPSPKARSKIRQIIPDLDLLREGTETAGKLRARHQFERTVDRMSSDLGCGRRAKYVTDFQKG